MQADDLESAATTLPSMCGVVSNGHGVGNQPQREQSGNSAADAAAAKDWGVVMWCWGLEKRVSVVSHACVPELFMLHTCLSI